MSFLDHHIGVKGPGRVADDVNAKQLTAVDHLFQLPLFLCKEGILIKIILILSAVGVGK